MATSRFNALDQALDIAGSLTQSSSMTLADEPNFLGSAITGQTGSSASIDSFSTPNITISGLTGMTAQSVGRFITISGSATSANNGTFLITSRLSATSVTYANPSGVASDANNGSIGWIERSPYSLEDDLNFARTDRAAIKGVAFSADIPTYERPTAVGTNVSANLSNLAGKTLDAHAWVTNRKYDDGYASTNDTFITITSVGNLKHADATNRTGVPIQDGADAGNHEATYVEIIDGYYGTESGLEVLSGDHVGKRIFGRTRAGSSTSPDSVEIEFRMVGKGQPLSSSLPYTWESGQPTQIDLYYGYRERADQLTETAFRTVLTNGIVGDADISRDIVDIRTVIGIADNVTKLTLTNTGNFYPFVNLPDVTPSVIEALNTLNEQIGARNYTGVTLTDGQTITASLQALSNAISGPGVSAVRTIERLENDIDAGTEHTIPGSQSYTADEDDNGQNMWVFWRGLLRDPGPVVDFNDYDETSTTSITPYTKLKSGDHINYIIYT